MNKNSQISNGVDQKLEHKRHTLAHLLAAAVLEQYPQVKLTLGPAVDTGFYYDIDFGNEKPGEADLKKIEKTMRKILPSWKEFSHEVVDVKKAKELFKGNAYKQEIIDEIANRGEDITLYTVGKFTDLCRGGHSENPAKEIAPDSFTLDRIAGAYWRGDEKNIMLTRIYGLAFDTKEELDTYVAMREEAKKRDHRKIAKEQDLLVFSDLVGSGMPIFTPKGNVVRSQIVQFSRELNNELGFGEVHSPNINKAELFKVSGHYDQYKEDMIEAKSQYVDDEMFLKPMNCPQHTQIYASRPRSYRDLPLRYADFAVLYRDERPGELSGLTRLRAFAQDDGHIFCREDQIGEEVSKVLDAIEKALKTYGIDYWMRLSLRDPEKKEKYLGDDSTWEKSQDIMRALLKEKKVQHKEAEGEAAFYGPKIDIMAVDALGREWQISTVQLDLNMPTRFKLTYIDSNGEEKTPVMIHRALIGSPDRFMGILIEHYAGAFPLWLSPVQVKVLPVSEKHAVYAQSVVKQLKQADIRSELDAGDESLGKRIRNAKLEKVPYFFVIGDKEVESNTVTVENRTESEGSKELNEVIETLQEKIKNRL